MKNKMDRIPVLMRNRKNLNNGSKYCKKKKIRKRTKRFNRTIMEASYNKPDSFLFLF